MAAGRRLALLALAPLGCIPCASHVAAWAACSGVVPARAAGRRSRLGSARCRHSCTRVVVATTALQGRERGEKSGSSTQRVEGAGRSRKGATPDRAKEQANAMGDKGRGRRQRHRSTKKATQGTDNRQGQGAMRKKQQYQVEGEEGK